MVILRSLLTSGSSKVGLNGILLPGLKEGNTLVKYLQ